MSFLDQFRKREAVEVGQSPIWANGAQQSAGPSQTWAPPNPHPSQPTYPQTGPPTTTFTPQPTYAFGGPNQINPQANPGPFEQHPPTNLTQPNSNNHPLFQPTPTPNEISSFQGPFAFSDGAQPYNQPTGPSPTFHPTAAPAFQPKPPVLTPSATTVHPSLRSKVEPKRTFEPRADPLVQPTYGGAALNVPKPAPYIIQTNVPSSPPSEDIMASAQTTYMYTKQLVLEKFGKATVSELPYVREKLDRLHQITAEFDRLLEVVRQVSSHFKNMKEAQKALGAFLKDNATREREWIKDALHEVGSAFQIADKHGEDIISCLTRLEDTATTFQKAAITDTLMSAEKYEKARINYDAARLKANSSTDFSNPASIQAQTALEAKRNSFQQLGIDLSEKMILITEKRVQILRTHIQEYLAANRKYYSACSSVFACIDTSAMQIDNQATTDAFSDLVRQRSPGEMDGFNDDGQVTEDALPPEDENHQPIDPDNPQIQIQFGQHPQSAPLNIHQPNLRHSNNNSRTPGRSPSPASQIARPLRNSGLGGLAQTLHTSKEEAFGLFMPSEPQQDSAQETNFGQHLQNNPPYGNPQENQQQNQPTSISQNNPQFSSARPRNPQQKQPTGFPQNNPIFAGANPSQPTFPQNNPPFMGPNSSQGSQPQQTQPTSFPQNNPPFSPHNPQFSQGNQQPSQQPNQTNSGPNFPQNNPPYAQPSQGNQQHNQTNSSFSQNNPPYIPTNQTSSGPNFPQNPPFVPLNSQPTQPNSGGPNFSQGNRPPFSPQGQGNQQTLPNPQPTFPQNNLSPQPQSQAGPNFSQNKPPFTPPYSPSQPQTTQKNPGPIFSQNNPPFQPSNPPRQAPSTLPQPTSSAQPQFTPTQNPPSSNQATHQNAPNQSQPAPGSQNPNPNPGPAAPVSGVVLSRGGAPANLDFLLD